MKKICFLSAIIALPLLYSCDKQEDRDRLTFVQWSGRPKHKNINDIIPINIQAKGDTMTFHGDNSAIFMEQSPYNIGVDSIKLYNKWLNPNSRDCDTAYCKSITTILYRNKASKTCEIKFMAKPNLTTSKISSHIRLAVFPMTSVTFVITQEPMQSTEGKQ